MTVTVTVPDAVAHRLEAVAKARGLTLEQLAVDVLSQVDAPTGDDAQNALDAFVGSGHGDGRRFNVHAARHELAERRQRAGTRHL